MRKYKRIKKCRVCGSEKLIPILNLGKIYVSDFVASFSNRGRIPLELILCENCNLLQLRHTTNPDLLYREYWYKSGINETIVADLKDIVSKVEEQVKLKEGDIVIDIGCNDGTLLRSYKTKGLKLVGFEPALNLIKEAKQGTTKIIPNYFSFKFYRRYFNEHKAKAITSIAMFYDLCVKPDTVLIGENKPIGLYNPNEMTFGLNGMMNNVIKTMTREYKGHMITIKPMYLEPIITTPEHPLLIVDGEKIRWHNGLLKRKKNWNLSREWVKAKYVKKGDYVVVPKLKTTYMEEELTLPPSHQGPRSILFDDEAAWVFGLYVAEGYTNQGSINFCLHQRETYVVERLRRFFDRIGRSIYVHRNSGLGIIASVKCKSLIAAFNQWFGRGARNKCIPDFIMLSRLSRRKSFLSGLLEGDGFMNTHQMTYRTSSHILALQVQLLIASLGIILGISKFQPRTSQTKNGRIIKSGISWALSSSSGKLSSFFMQGPLKPYREWDNHIILDDAILVPIHKVSIEQYEGKVCNIQTSDNTYLVSNAVVHNCDPNKFINDIIKTLDDNGVWIIEMRYLPLMLQQNDISNICHEHLLYYSLMSLQKLLERHNLEVVDVEINNVNGGSLRAYIRFKNIFPIHSTVSNLVKQEKKTRLDTIEPYSKFALRALNIKQQIYDFIKKEHDAGKKIFVYGASTKGNTMLQYFGIDHNLIEAAAERDSRKFGMKTIATEIPIISEEESRKNADYFLILPWHFLDAFIKREKEFLSSGGKFIVPLPEFKVIP